MSEKVALKQVQAGSIEFAYEERRNACMPVLLTLLPAAAPPLAVVPEYKPEASLAFFGCEKRHLFLSFPYVCSEPVLAK